MIQTVEQSQARQMAAVEDWMMNLFSVDEFDDVYHSFRSTTTTGLEIGFLVAGNRLAKIPIKASRALSKGLYRSESAYQGRLLHSHLKHVQKYGTQGYKKLASGRIRYYGDIELSKTKGEMLGRRLVREWNPQTGLKRTWHETIDQSGNIRIIRPEANDGSKIHYLFDSTGIFEGTR